VSQVWCVQKEPSFHLCDRGLYSHCAGWAGVGQFSGSLRDIYARRLRLAAGRGDSALGGTLAEEITLLTGAGVPYREIPRKRTPANSRFTGAVAIEGAA